ncbi:MAG: hypothetical protein ETSY2_14890 [Candidatus Entotheonella gemina]|uniref:Uncharacterized protein n=1 Tax=Candidatus Entotheonella gemina TaxID=1429439 RepID=W4MB06_9BACT|nr:MAG: hypothetical protein ETSY2_14890 [Candidatus Entotheonella gemina]
MILGYDRSLEMIYWPAKAEAALLGTGTCTAQVICVKKGMKPL